MKRNAPLRVLPRVKIGGKSKNAGMMELADMQDLGSCAVMRWGSSPHARTKKYRYTFVCLYFFIARKELERAASVDTLMQKLRASEQFLARGKVRLFRSAVRRTVKRNKLHHKLKRQIKSRLAHQPLPRQPSQNTT